MDIPRGSAAYVRD